MERFKLTYEPYRLQFNFKAKTSRGEISEKVIFILKIEDTQTGTVGVGEVAPLDGLSIDFSTVEDKLKAICKSYNTLDEILNLNLLDFPSLVFGLETAILDLQNGGKQLIFDSEFLRGTPIPINGLIWMADKKTMFNELVKKIEQGFTTIKLKVGAIDFEEELSLIKYIRENFSEKEITIRLDANGAFTEKDVFQKLDKFSKYNIHSIEQPIMKGNWDFMKEICKKSSISIVLDEELIGEQVRKLELLSKISPHYIILKPTLVGGFAQCREWIAEAEKRKIRWWITSALESNIGLNAIAQFTATFPDLLPQGLGTGGLYTNNFPSPLVVKNGKLFYSIKN